ncbi:uncharacterized protein J4E79_000600 [Alternaria viburni]|uniref:uncharacterized protein n=1 Tax=Alternaria viburni TaxID=566460 RepID=UPI0020C4DE58|nr:uncharacterized protein J4E79_000600 [Alternaria viburni]KAI4670319.1 hypothetical protein J4E79_000600 [Alternaria viburni]
MAFRRAYGNLGSLYSISPPGAVPSFGLTRPQYNSVNLGSLYARSKSKFPTGWAYFEDGSVFILPFAWFPHDTFEARMKIAAQFVSGPTPKMQEIRRENPHMKRFIIINKDTRQLRENTFRILARNAQDGQRVSVADPPFENVELTLDPTESRPISARFNDAPQLKFKHRLRNSEALETFRGTLVDGVLQPNVRLGNGLRLSNKPEMLKPQLTAKRRARNHEAARLRESVGLPPKAPAKLLDGLDVRSLRERPLPTSSDRRKPFPRTPPRDRDLELREAHLASKELELIKLQQQLLRQTMRIQNSPPRRERHPRSQPRDDNYTNTHRTRESSEARTYTESDTTAAEIEARRKALEQEEELLRYKRKAWLLEQKLAEASARPPRSPRRRPARQYDDEAQDYDDTRYSIEVPPERDALSDVQHDEGAADGNDLDNSSPTEALQSLRSRIQLPTRQTMRSHRTPR